jgi:hypothetical protein
MAIFVKRFFVDEIGQKKFTDVVRVEDASVADEMTKSVCEKFNSDLGAYCIDMDDQVILHKWYWDAQADPPCAKKDW